MTEELMRRVSEYVAKPIISADTRENVGTMAADVLMDADAGQIVGVILGEGLLTSEQARPTQTCRSWEATPSSPSRGSGSSWRESGAKPAGTAPERRPARTSE